MKTLLIALLSSALISSSVMYGDSSQDQDPVLSSAFKTMLNEMYPVSPNEVDQYHHKLLQQEKMQAMPNSSSPDVGQSTVITATLKLGDPMPVLRIGRGMITSVIFTDIKGNVWPVESYIIGDPSAFNIQWDQKSGLMMFQGKKSFNQTNMAVMLKGLQVPVMVNLLVGQKKWDYLNYVRVMAVPSGAGSISSGDVPSYLMAIANGTKLANAKKLRSSASQVMAWEYNGNYIISSKYPMLSPRFINQLRGSGSSSSKSYVYEIPKTSRIVISQNGQMKSVTLSRINVQGGL